MLYPDWEPWFYTKTMAMTIWLQHDDDDMVNNIIEEVHAIERVPNTAC